MSDKTYYSIFAKFEDFNGKDKFIYLCKNKDIALKQINILIDQINSTIKDLEKDDYDPFDLGLNTPEYCHTDSIENGYCLEDVFDCVLAGDVWFYKFKLTVELVHNNNGIIQIL